MAIKEKLRTLYKQYGRVGIGVYLSVSAVSISSIYALLKAGVNVDPLVKRLPAFLRHDSKEMEQDEAIAEQLLAPPYSNNGNGKSVLKSERAKSWGMLLLALGLHKMLLPVRVFATVSLTPAIARWLHRAPK